MDLTGIVPSIDDEFYYRGDIDSKGYQIYLGHFFGDSVKLLSPFHSINLWPDYGVKSIVNMIVEVPQGTIRKLEISKEVPLNPIMYDIKNGNIREINYVAKGRDKPGYPFHYGAFPKTWEHAGKMDNRIGLFGDNDPIDVFDISGLPAFPGMIKTVKILGAIAMIDVGETDWKVICIDTKDEHCNDYNDISDVPAEVMETLDDFLTNYKVAEGKGQNKFADKRIWNRDEAIDIVNDGHKHWSKLTGSRGTALKDTTKNRPDAVKSVKKIKMLAEAVYPINMVKDNAPDEE